MPGYVVKLLHCFQHDNPTKMQHQPHPHVPPSYGVKTKYFTCLDDSQPLNKEGKTCIMKVTITFVYYAGAVDGTTLTELIAITSEQSSPTERTMNTGKKFSFTQ